MNVSSIMSANRIPFVLQIDFLHSYYRFLCWRICYANFQIFNLPMILCIHYKLWLNADLCLSAATSHPLLANNLNVKGNVYIYIYIYNQGSLYHSVAICRLCDKVCGEQLQCTKVYLSACTCSLFVRPTYYCLLYK